MATATAYRLEYLDNGAWTHSSVTFDSYARAERASGRYVDDGLAIRIVAVEEWDGYCRHDVFVGGSGRDIPCWRCESGD